MKNSYFKRSLEAATLCLVCLMAFTSCRSTSPYVSVRDGHFELKGREYRFVGANLWFGAILGSEGLGGNRQRLCQELDFMRETGITNVRVLVGGDGISDDPSHIAPVLQTAPGVYNDTILKGLDFLMAELEKRDMKAVLYLNNSWDWSGGFGTYLEWAGEKKGGSVEFTGAVDAPVVDEWTEFQRFHSQFTRNDSALAMAERHTRFIVSRKNTITGKPYTESPALMAWELANEPRAFARDSATLESFARWIQTQARIIKSIDHNHLVTTGSEGKYGCEVSLDLFKRIHTYPEIDYACIHVWPFNWTWLGQFAPNTQQAIANNGAESVIKNVGYACQQTQKYVDEHCVTLKGTGKPIVLEEFGYPRDGYKIAKGTPTTGRDTYYKYVFDLVCDGSQIAGCNFWAWGGSANVRHANWQRWDDYTGDPAQEEQGLNSVFSSDKSTLELIKQASLRLKTEK